MYSLDDQIALVTGAAQGIGKTISERLEEAGAMVIRTDFRDWTNELSTLGGQSFGLQLDVTDLDDVKRAVKIVWEKFGKIDILVNNAGITRDNLLIRMKEEEWKQVISTNLEGVFYTTRELVARMMRKRYGRVINISSVVGQIGNPGQANYVASKAGVIGFTKAVAREVASRNITVNAVAPGFIGTAMTENLSEKVQAQLLDKIPLGRMGTVEDIANGVLFLAAKESGYITGHVLNINGGMHM
jgi:3-oxoacyl-[acyl-carrier protein] reductase